MFFKTIITFSLYVLFFTSKYISGNQHVKIIMYEVRVRLQVLITHCWYTVLNIITQLGYQADLKQQIV